MTRKTAAITPAATRPSAMPPPPPARRSVITSSTAVRASTKSIILTGIYRLCRARMPPSPRMSTSSP